MYGLVNRAIEQLVVSTGGEAAWQRVCQRAGIGAEGFVAMCPYDDGVTYRLVGAVSQELGQSAEQVLEAFGNYWVLYTAEEGYGELMHACGDDLRQFLDNLNELHGRIETIFPGLRPPHFEVHDVAPGEYRVHYVSGREGLAPMVVGLLKGLARRFGQSVAIEQLPTGQGLAGCFQVRHLDATSTA
ncbi:heme NO-binding domain-containing protein [Azohydromonas aeria]|uniref:heme NO-binding domain-containing protein n=1 Tax=Azohydromonas aeria TaxID=2590212 RepID=UPI0012F7CF32|nr:heme NO-binding domain-containing protein [Azohydromonas aeria]